MPAIYSLAANKIYRNGKHAATIDGDDLTYKHGFKQHAEEIKDFLKDLKEAEATDPVAEATDPVAEPPTPEPPAPEPPAPKAQEIHTDDDTEAAPDPAPKKRGRPKKPDNPEPPMSPRFGDLTPELVHWRHENWPKNKFRAHYHRRLSAFPELQD